MKQFLFSFLVFLSISLFAQQKVEDPVAVDDSVSMMQYGTIHINVLANDYDPNGEAIYIDDLDEEEGFEISFQDSIVTIKALIYYDWEHLNLDYRIRNESGESDRANIDIYFVENPDVPVPVTDFIELKTQTALIVNLVDNDEYSGAEELVISEITESKYFHIEIQSNQQSIKISAGIYSGPFRFGYRIKENGGNTYESKWVFNTVFIRGNENAPIGKADSFTLQRGEIKFLDVLSNDISNMNLSVDTTGLPAYVQIVDDQISISCPLDFYDFQNLDFQYYAKDENGLLSQLTKVSIEVSDALRAPIAVDDVFEVDFADTLVFDVLKNDSNFLDQDLVLANGETLLKKINSGPNIRYGWQSLSYQCKNVETEYLSNEAFVRYYLRSPDGVELPDVKFNYKMGETLEFKPSDYNNIPDSISNYSANSLNNIGSLINSDITTLRYHCEPGALSEYFFENDSLFDQIKVTYMYFNEEGFTFYDQYFNIYYENVNSYSFLDVNNFKIPVSPFGTSYSSIHKPENQFIDATSDDGYSYLLELIQPWIALEYEASESLHISADDLYANHFFPGPAMDDYTEDYELKYFRTWEVTKAEIEEHKNNYADAAYQMPEAIENWPAGPLAYNGITYEQADYVDFNSNQIYDPENGDYPKISGDKAILYIKNDNRSYVNNNAYADSLNMDIYALVFAFNRPESDLFHNTFFIKYKIVNKSNLDYQNFRFAQYVENSLFNIRDYIGCDTLLNTFYRYPMAQNQNQYTSSMTLLNQKMDKFLTVGDIDIGDQVFYSNMMGTYGDPFYFWQPPVWQDYAPLDYVFPGRIGDLESWNNFTHFNDAFTYGVAYGGVTTSESMDFAQGDSKYFEFAFSVNYHPEQDYFDFANMALDRAAQLIECYQNDSVPGGGSFTGIKEYDINSNTELLIYPNPANTILYVDGAEESSEYSIYTLQGQKIEEGRLENEISIDHLSDGFYLLQIKSLDEKHEWTSKFVKQ